MPVSLAVDIRPLFRDSPDIDSMQGFGLDLSSYEDVKARASEIYARLAEAACLCSKMLMFHRRPTRVQIRVFHILQTS